MTFKEVWSFTVTATEVNDKPVVCVSINLFKLKVDKYQSLNILIEDTLPVPSGFVIYNSSPFQFNPNNGKNDNFEMIPTGSGRMMKMRMKSIERKSTRKFKCDESNQAKYTQCIESFIVGELQCKPSWFQIIDNKVPPCNGRKKYQKFSALIKDLSKANCLVSNCKQKIWESEEIWTTPEAPVKNATLIQYWTLTKTEKVSKEVFTYGVFNIFNDFAGVLSLIFGVSIISFYDYIVDTSKKMYSTLTTLKK